MNSRYLALALLTIPAALAAGWFGEKTPAYKTVPKEARIYLQDKGLKDLKGALALFQAGDEIDYVNLDRNELEVFPEELASLSGLKWLRLNDNRLAKLPDLSRLVNLRRIYLRDNNFAEVPETLKDLPSLTDIELSGNYKIKEIPDWLAKKEGLENLSFNRTSITSLPEDISAWRSLKSLQLGELKLSRDEMKRLRRVLPDTVIVF